MKKSQMFLSIAAGLLGGVLSHYLWLQPVQAQAPAPTPKELRAQSFALVNDLGQVQGVFTYDQKTPGRTVVKLYDNTGREIWSAGGNPAHPLSAAAPPR